MSTAEARGPANRLAKSTSPYLLQHAHNPVDWHEWGPEAFAEARRRNVPIFLSVGYSTCYWCHVMERESFESRATAEVMNRLFVNVKVDREERPDVDEVYMAAVQMLTGRGGWPMSVFLEPDTLRPYWGGTYFPPRPMHGLPSFAQAMEGMADAFANRRADVATQAGRIAAAVAEKLGEQRAAPVHVGRPQIAMAAQTLLTILDRAHGGFGNAPKFPQPVYLTLLQEARARAADQATRDALEAALRLTLDQMALGGIFDHLAGGFHRYSVDRFWTVPHFEKMLYDQALLLPAYARAAVEFNDPLYRRTAQRTAEYVLRDMTSREGAFFTAQDAEVDGREGLNYLWTPQQIRDALPKDDAEIAIDLLGLAAGPNFQDPHHPGEAASNVLRLAERPEASAARLGMSGPDLLARLESIAASLDAVRRGRKQPRLDDKILTSWNGLMIAGLAAAGRLLARAGYVAAADRAADFLLATLRARDGGLLRTFRAGVAQLPGSLDDYAFLAGGLLELARAHAESNADAARSRLASARDLVARAADRFGAGPTAGPAEASAGRFARGLFDTEADRPDLFVRPRSTYDGAIPSGVSVMIGNLVSIAQMCGPSGPAALRDLPAAHEAARDAAALIASISPAIDESPIATANSTTALLRLLGTDEPTAVGVLSEAAGSAMPSAAATAQPAGEVVQVFTSEEMLLIGPDLPASCRVRVVIAPGYHLNAHDPHGTPADGTPARPGSTLGLIPTRFEIHGGSGLAVYADYPPGERLDAADPDSPMVYAGMLEFDLAIEQVGDWAGDPRLVLAFQACTDRACLEESRVELALELRHSPEGSPDAV